MEEITLEKTHALLERLAEYVINEVPRKDDVPTKKEVDGKFQKVYDQVWNLREELDQKTYKKDVEMLKNNLRKLLDGQDEIIKQLDTIGTEQYAISDTLDRHEQRYDLLETKTER